ncbi:MAG: hypothetical protein K2N47_00705 [Clostridia bacterium]|nr:hypothetical protein [Clostridia bacterium]
MIENETAVVNDEAGKVEEVAETPKKVAEVKDEKPAPAAPEKKPGVGAKIKEWFRKFCVNLKRKPQNIPFVILAAINVYQLRALTRFSHAVIRYAGTIEWVGLMVFINTLFSILILVAFLNTFPKLKKPKSKIVFTMTESGVKLNVNIIFLVVMALMAVAMIVCNAVYHKIMTPFYIKNYVEFPDPTAIDQAAKALVGSTLTLSIVHIILLGVYLVLFFTLPLYRKLIMKIDTSVKLESATENIKEIDLQED